MELLESLACKLDDPVGRVDLAQQVTGTVASERGSGDRTDQPEIIGRAGDRLKPGWRGSSWQLNRRSAEHPPVFQLLKMKPRCAAPERCQEGPTVTATEREVTEHGNELRRKKDSLTTP